MANGRPAELIEVLKRLGEQAAEIAELRREIEELKRK
jgi:hypothetical protein